ncbi:RxLR effector protein [Phytophthora megakarya]|uniref:RxLR effector protein n=1 Tax=Phytophthora megakarya TaxID=4795 RepID=A0A225VC87_9STRA|nr:RxLR effector protein [Phytophthora megakarya]
MIATLTAKYGDEGLAKLFQAAKNVPESEAVATKLQTEQMWVWLTNGNSIDAVLKLLKLDDGVDKVFMNPNLKSWEDYIQFYNKFMDEKPTTTIDSLMKFYGDETVAKMLEAATKAPNARKIATDLQTAQFTQWLREGAKPAQIWKLLNMNKQTWMTNPDAQVFYKYVEFYKLHK